MKSALDFLGRRSAGEKTALIAAAGVFLLLADLIFLVNPMIRSVAKTAPKVMETGRELKRLREDAKNKDAIRKEWETLKERLAGEESRFVSAAEVPALFENLSRQAFDSGVKIMSIRPTETRRSPAASAAYAPLPIQMSALAGTHEFGDFLGRLEAAGTFFKVTDLKIASNPADERRHLVDLKMEIYKRP
ncbi:MAG: type 4a pilus biogenesis protein PilO [Candidatus Omnitrophica bacterium]|nr:type 4a pilus biogenesis protein PilO [Candidatus Omnitrophota bacterium]